MFQQQVALMCFFRTSSTHGLVFRADPECSSQVLSARCCQKLEKRKRLTLFHYFALNVESVFTLEGFAKTMERNRILALAAAPDMEMETRLKSWRWCGRGYVQFSPAHETLTSPVAIQI